MGIRILVRRLATTGTEIGILRSEELPPEVTASMAGLRGAGFGVLMVQTQLNVELQHTYIQRKPLKQQPVRSKNLNPERGAMTGVPGWQPSITTQKTAFKIKVFGSLLLLFHGFDDLLLTWAHWPRTAWRRGVANEATYTVCVYVYVYVYVSVYVCARVRVSVGEGLGLDVCLHRYTKYMYTCICTRTRTIIHMSCVDIHIYI